MRTTVTIDDELLGEAKLLAVRTHRTIGSVLEDALRGLLSAQDRAAPRGRFELPSYPAAEPGLQQGFDLFDREQIADLAGDNAPHALS